MGVFQLGKVFTVLLSEMVVSGFTTGVAFHVLTSQVKNLLGIPVPRYSGPFKAFYTYRDLLKNLMSANLVVLGVSTFCVVVLVVNNEVIKPCVRRVSRLPVPAEVVVVVAGTWVSYLLDLQDLYQVPVIGHIPEGLPAPAPPPLGLLPLVVTKGLLIALVSYSTTFAISMVFAANHGYKVHAEQELYAQGISNVFGSFFSCGPVAASLSRSLIQEASGGVTLLTAFFSCIFLLIILFVVGPFLSTLPHCVLSCIIVVSLKGLFLQVHDLPKLWSSSRPDAVIWLVSCLVSIVVDLDYGLLAGVITSLLVLLLRSHQPDAATLGHVPSTDLYLDLKRYKKAAEVPGVKIFQFGGPIHFCNAPYFRSSLFSVTGLDLEAMKAAKDALPQTHEMSTEDELKNVPRWLVLDMTLVSFVDSTGATVLKQLHKDLQLAGVTLCLASASYRTLKTLDKCGVMQKVSSNLIFHSIHDAVTAITCNGSSHQCNAQHHIQSPRDSGSSNGNTERSPCEWRLKSSNSLSQIP